MNFTQDFLKQQKNLCLVGFSPSDALDSVSIAIKFWNFQKQLEFQKKSFSLNKNDSNVNNKLTNYENEYSNLMLKYKILQEKYEKLNNCYTNIQYLEAEKSKIKETPVIFCPPSNQRLKNRIADQKTGRSHVNLFTPFN